MMQRFLSVAVPILFANTLAAQTYLTAAGVRLGTDLGFTFKQRVLEHTTLEGIVQSSLFREEFMVTGLVEQHFPLATKGLNFYLGVGLHKGWIQEGPTLEHPDGFKHPLGMDALAGLELNLGRLNLSYDYKPAFNLVGGERKFYMQTGLSARYMFINNHDLRKKAREKKRQARREKLRFWERD